MSDLTLKELFETKFVPDPNSGCWLWTAAIGSRGYGSFIPPKAFAKPSTHIASRVSWLLYRGEIPRGLFVCHKCDVRCCVNPNHLFLGSPADNMQDMVSKGRYKSPWSSKTHCKQGHPFSGDNLAIYTPGRRSCRACKRALERKYYRSSLKRRLKSGATR